MKVSDLKFNKRNPRYIKDYRYEKLKIQIEEFPKMLQLRPIIYNPENMEILGGNMRLRALIDLGYTKISNKWTKPANELTEEEKERFIIVDNIGFGEFDYQIINDDWDTERLNHWGLEGFETSKVDPPKEVTIKPYNKTYILLSFPPDQFEKIESIIKKITKLKGVEYEQASN